MFGQYKIQARIRNYSPQQKIWTEEEGFIHLPNILFDVCDFTSEREDEGFICIYLGNEILTAQNIDFDFEVGELGESFDRP